MHEMGIALQILKIATDAIPAEAKSIPVKKVNIQVGKLTAVVPESLRFCFDVAIKDTPLNGAELSIEELPIRGRCPKCRSDSRHRAPLLCGERSRVAHHFCRGAPRVDAARNKVRRDRRRRSYAHSPRTFRAGHIRCSQKRQLGRPGCGRRPCPAAGRRGSTANCPVIVIILQTTRSTLRIIRGSR